MIEENKQQIKPDIETVVNLGVSFFHLNDTEKTEKPNDEASPKINPITLVEFLSIDIITIPEAAKIIAIHTFKEIFSLRNRNPNKAVINGIAAKHKSVIAAEVLVIDHINEIIATAKPDPPTRPEIPIF